MINAPICGLGVTMRDLFAAIPRARPTPGYGNTRLKNRKRYHSSSRYVPAGRYRNCGHMGISPKSVIRATLRKQSAMGGLAG